MGDASATDIDETEVDETETEVDEQQEETPGEGDSDDAGIDGEDALGDPGKKALDAMKKKWHAEREKRRELEQKLSGDDRPDEATTAILAKANDRIRRSEVKAAAKGKLNDPADAFKFLDLDQFEVSEDGEIDETEITEAIDELIKSKPYLAAQGRRFQGDASQGVRKGSRPRQLSRDDLRGMTPQQISEAKAKGQLADLLKTT